MGEQPAGGLASCAIGLASGQHLSGIRASAYTVCRTARTVLVCMYIRMFKFVHLIAEAKEEEEEEEEEEV